MYPSLILQGTATLHCSAALIAMVRIHQLGDHALAGLFYARRYKMMGVTGRLSVHNAYV